ncbi:S-methylmethionine-dependent homocysteine/selenocysteine methylase [Novosphingobium capsulatum]|uniref:S-methylmethionine-dependent homocysteine/selenocysteine methylase n=1 Tax=Novosphingobium capsulatum TaxID=13688 RepID=A0ABU1MRH9_9SPHN|nr:homocysteine S-methyltransferase family protein [Novosphingobium capsulatum]MDR6512642.1 S-methylmethionine-dependent homocysteine/selenocysteine methylase [Novosphingobium capsulatum]
MSLVILDGGTGRELARCGAPFRQPEWSALALIEAPEFVAQVHQRYVDAGADVITTNSYAVVPFHIGQDRFDAHGAQWAALAGSLARAVADAAPRGVKVAGSLPPVSGSYRPDLIDLERSRAVLAVLVAALAPHVDHWQAETLSAIAEAELVADLIAPTGKPLWLSFTLADEDPAAAPQLRSGESVEAAAAAALRLGAQALLFNCSQPEVMAAAVAQAKAALAGSGVAIGVYANAFPPQGADAEANNGLSPIRADLTPEGYAAFARAWAAEGATILGGCCGIGPEHIAVLRGELA